MNKLLVILGPTATGKTDLALHLAKKFHGELVACDSRQVYIGLDIGTGKMPGNKATIPVCQLNSKPGLDIRKGKDFWEIDGVRIWMYDVVSPKVQYTVADYVKDADRVIRGIWERGKLPIIVGGTGLYLKALLEGMSNLAVPVDTDLREKLEKLSLEQLQIKLKKLSRKKWENLNESDRENPRRLVRAIELIMSSLRRQGSNQLSLVRNWIPAYAGMTGTDVLKIGLTAPREVLYKNADAQVLSWIGQGIIEEVKKLRDSGVSLKRMRELGLEYGVLADYLEGEIREIEGNMGLIKIMQRKIHSYVRRQLTWFKNPSTHSNNSGHASSGYINWFDITNKDYINNVEILVSSWYHKLK